MADQTIRHADYERGCDVHGHAFPHGSQVCAQCGHIAEDVDPSSLDDLTYWAWTIIANAYEGDWFKATDEWREAAIRWRGAFHASLHNDGSECG